MKVVVAIDSFKGSLSSLEAGNAAKKGILKTDPYADVTVVSIADGGEGTIDSIMKRMGAEKVTLNACGPEKDIVSSYYGIDKKTKTAIIEMAKVSGLTLVKKEMNPFKTTTYGLGELILDAIDRGCDNFIIGIGGSATNDGGIGMLQALGYEFLDKDGKQVGEGAQALDKIHSISDEKVSDKLQNCQFSIACDVNNPLCGENGATYIFGPQKGLATENLEKVDKGMEHYAKLSSEYSLKYQVNFPGAGAAGGLGFAFLNFLNAKLKSGVELIIELINLENEIKDADYVLCGEGKLDSQSILGKAPIGVANVAKKYDIPVLAIAGTIGESAGVCLNHGIDSYFSITHGPCSIEDAMKKENAERNLAETVEQIFRLLNLSCQHN